MNDVLTSSLLPEISPRGQNKKQTMIRVFKLKLTPRTSGHMMYDLFTRPSRLRRTVLFDDDTYLKGRGFDATMEARLWLETSDEFKQVCLRACVREKHSVSERVASKGGNKTDPTTHVRTYGTQVVRLPTQ